MSAPVLHLDRELASSTSGPAGAPNGTASEAAADVPSLEKMRELGRSESLRWELISSCGLAPKICCRDVISTLIQHAAEGGGALKSLPREDSDWLLDNLRVIRTAFREVMESRRDRSLEPHLQGHDQKLHVRTEMIAKAFLEAVRFEFNAAALADYLDGWQETQKLTMSELWALKPALQLSALQELAECVASVVQQPPSAVVFTPVPGRIPIPRLITVLRTIGETDWSLFLEQVSAVDSILRHDPAAVYSNMDEESRTLYRNAVVELAKYSNRTEWEIADAVVSMAESAAQQDAGDPQISEKRIHVGYYLIGAGLSQVRSIVNYRPGLKQSLRDASLRFPNLFYLVGIEVVTLAIVVLVLAGLPHLSPIVPAFFCLLIPATQAAVELVNAIVTAIVPARPLPKLDFSEGIPDACKTLVAVPALLLNEHQVQDLVSQLEIRYLANREANLYFALLTDSPDSNQPFDTKDSLAAYCAGRIRELNRKHTRSENGPFFLFHRNRMFNPSQNTWMGWERKRGKLLDLSRLLGGEHDRFPLKVGDLSVLPNIRFVITLDADTQLPREAAHRLVGTLAHPLNRAVIDPSTNTVTEGYGILQPRVGISVQSASRSWLASIYSGQTGFDIYTRAVSDVYQDLYGEGSFAGKGIFDVRVFQQVFNDRFPCNTLLSHDLIEGAYARAALVSDVEVIEDYPSHFSAYSRRRHRWVRGDWQISQWLFSRVPDFHGRMVPNPISIVSRWKIFDNLRRSLVDPCLLSLLLAGWFFLPGPAWYWTIITASLLLISAYTHALLSLLRIRDLRHLSGVLQSTAADLAKGHLNVLVTLTFLPHQALVMIDAVVRTVVRHRITRRRLLEWETAAEAETGQPNRRPADTYLAWTPWIALGLTLTIALARPGSAPYAILLLLLWAAAPAVARWLSREKTVACVIATPKQMQFLRTSALHMWRYFKENSGPAENWLIPDNIQESPAFAAHRTSPTNLGLLLNARQAAHELGYLTLPEFVTATSHTLSIMTTLPKHRGHFFNWYDTLQLCPIDPPIVSTVDSGNLAASLWTLKQGCRSLAEAPIFPPSLWHGMSDYIRLLRKLDRGRAQKLHVLTRHWGKDALQWLSGLDALERSVQPLLSAPAAEVRHWSAELLERIFSVRSFVRTVAPWFGVMDDSGLRNLLGDGQTCVAELTLGHVPLLAERFRSQLKSPEFYELNEAMLRAAVMAETLKSELEKLAAQAGRMVDEMDFRFLYDERKKLLSIGYNAATGRLHAARYDLLASEARIAAFVAVAKGDVPQKSWFHLGRAQTAWAGHRILLSWTGTMFEYLMPALWMRIYPRTLLEQSTRAVAEIQRVYGRKTRIPWGISESAYSVTDGNGCYQYRAFGLPMLALKRSTKHPRVVAPYASYLALGVQPIAAIRNLYRMTKRGWSGKYGLYEAVDFDTKGEPAVVRCWMAHHHGMSLMAVANCLLESPFQRYFHAEPQVMATELLLHERVPVGVRIEREAGFVLTLGLEATAYSPDHVSVKTLPN